MHMFGQYSGYVQAAARVLLGSLFFVTGAGIVFGGAAAFNGYQSMVVSAGIPMAGLAAVIAIAIKLFGGAALALGFKARYAAISLAVFTLLATYFFHGPGTWGDPATGYVNYLMALKNLSIIGGLLLVANNGAGAMALKCNDTCKWCQ